MGRLGLLSAAAAGSRVPKKGANGGNMVSPGKRAARPPGRRNALERIRDSNPCPRRERAVSTSAYAGVSGRDRPPWGNSWANHRRAEGRERLGGAGELVGQCVPVPAPNEAGVGVPGQTGDGVRGEAGGERVRRLRVPPPLELLASAHVLRSRRIPSPRCAPILAEPGLDVARQLDRDAMDIRPGHA